MTCEQLIYVCIYKQNLRWIIIEWIKKITFSNIYIYMNYDKWKMSFQYGTNKYEHLNFSFIYG